MTYVPASWRCTLPAEECGVGLAFNLQLGDTVRLFLDRESAQQLVATLANSLARYNSSHSPRSSGIPSFEVSMPGPAENV